MRTVSLALCCRYRHSCSYPCLTKPRLAFVQVESSDNDTPYDTERVFVPWAALAEHGNFGSNGRLNLLGILDVLVASKFPFRPGRLVFAFRLRIENSRAQRRELRFALLDATGEPVVESAADLEHGNIPYDSLYHEDYILDLPGVELDPLLSAWEITESYPGDGISRRRRYHREQPNLPFSYGMRQQLEGPYVIQLCQQIRELHRRLTR